MDKVERIARTTSIDSGLPIVFNYLDDPSHLQAWFIGATHQGYVVKLGVGWQLTLSFDVAGQSFETLARCTERIAGFGLAIEISAPFAMRWTFLVSTVGQGTTIVTDLRYVAPAALLADKGQRRVYRELLLGTELALANIRRCCEPAAAPRESRPRVAGVSWPVAP